MLVKKTQRVTKFVKDGTPLLRSQLIFRLADPTQVHCSLFVVDLQRPGTSVGPRAIVAIESNSDITLILDEDKLDICVAFPFRKHGTDFSLLNLVPLVISLQERVTDFLRNQCQWATPKEHGDAKPTCPTSQRRLAF